MYFLAIKPLYTGEGGIIHPAQSVKALRSLNSQYDGTLKNAESLVNQAKTMRAQYSAISPEDKAKIAVMVPESVDKVRLLSEVYGLGEDAGFSLDSLSYTDGGSIAGKGIVNISFSVKTTYPRFKVLMDNFEKSMRLYSIEGVSFVSPQKEGDLITYQVRLKTYYLK